MKKNKAKKNNLVFGCFYVQIKRKFNYETDIEKKPKESDYLLLKHFIYFGVADRRKQLEDAFSFAKEIHSSMSYTNHVIVTNSIGVNRPLIKLEASINIEGSK